MNTPPIEAVEFARGCLASLAFLTPTQAREVHILRIRRAFEVAGNAHKLGFALYVLNLMREAEDLGNGYWFPTPTRVVEGNNVALIFSVSPTEELRRHFSSVKAAGYARVVGAEHAGPLPKQSIQSWMGTPGESDIAEWTRAQLNAGGRSLGPTVHTGRTEYFSIFSTSMRGSRGNRSLWTTDLARAIACDHGMVMCRERQSATTYRHFFGRVDRSRLVAESNVRFDISRMQFGVAALVSKPLSVRAMRNGRSAVFVVSSPLPLPERRLLLALGPRSARLGAKEYWIEHGDASNLIEKQLLALGADVRWEQ